MLRELPTRGDVTDAVLGLLDLSRYEVEVRSPVLDAYIQREFKNYPDLGGAQIFSFDLDSLQVGDIEEEHIHRITTEFGALAFHIIDL